MEPFSAILMKVGAGKAIDIALGLIQDSRGRAERENQREIDRLVAYLEIAQAAIAGLAVEREQILVQARHADPADQSSRDATLRRIDSYLHSNLLRPNLGLAIVGVRACSSDLEKQANTTWQVPWKKSDRKVAVGELKLILDSLVNFLNSLGDLLDYEAPSGLGKKELIELDHTLRHQSLARDANEVRAKIEKIVADGRNEGSRAWVDVLEGMVNLEGSLNRVFK